MEKKPNSEKNAFSGFQKAYNPHLKKNKIAKKPQEEEKKTMQETEPLEPKEKSIPILINCWLKELIKLKVKE